jgi:hypothetical protein
MAKSKRVLVKIEAPKGVRVRVKRERKGSKRKGKKGRKGKGKSKKG